MHYRTVIFIQYGDDTLSDLISDRDEEGMFEHLYQWETGEGEAATFEPWGNSDQVAYFNRGPTQYALSYNTGLNYASLTAIENI